MKNPSTRRKNRNEGAVRPVRQTRPSTAVVNAGLTRWHVAGLILSSNRHVTYDDLLLCLKREIARRWGAKALHQPVRRARKKEELVMVLDENDWRRYLFAKGNKDNGAVSNGA